MAVTVTTIDAAITEILTSGQSFTLDGVTYSRGNLNALYALRQTLIMESAQSEGTRPAMRGFNFSGMGY